MRQWSFLWGISKKHANDRAHVVLDLNDEDFVVIADKYRTSAVRWQNSTDGNRHNISVHTISVSGEEEKTSLVRLDVAGRWRAAPPRCFEIAIAPRAAFLQDRPVNFRSKIVALNSLVAWRADVRASGRRLAVTNGCFDLLHPGHVTYLEQARNQADLLLIGLNGDGSVRELKGPGRPVNTQEDRALVVAALASVDAVCIFPEKSAAAFLAVAQPDVYVKGGDYTIETLNPQERKLVESAGGKIVIIPFVPGKSTTALLEKIARL